MEGRKLKTESEASRVKKLLAQRNVGDRGTLKLGGTACYSVEVHGNGNGTKTVKIDCKDKNSSHIFNHEAHGTTLNSGQIKQIDWTDDHQNN